MALSPEQYASELRFKLSLQGRVDVEQVASSLGIRVYEDELDGCDGVLLRLDGKALIITSRKCTYSTRKRFTIAHESGHFCIPSHDSCEFRRWPPLKFTLGLDGLIHMSFSIVIHTLDMVKQRVLSYGHLGLPGVPGWEQMANQDWTPGRCHELTRTV